MKMGRWGEKYGLDGFMLRLDDEGMIQKALKR